MINITETGRAYCNPKELNLSKISTGAVMGWYAIIITAPNSLIPLANIITEPEIICRMASGMDMVRNTRNGEAPRFNAAFSRRSGTPVNPSLAALRKNGRLTKAMARIIPDG